ncbi:hypothetical protein ACFL6D_00750 [Spirochaetota bacterium]
MKGISTLDERRKNLENIILSVSGWRKIFASDGDEESMTTDLSACDYEFIACAALVFYEKIIGGNDNTKGGQKKRTTVSIGIDSRPTGKTIAGIFINYAKGKGMEVEYSSVCPGPEIFAYTQLCKNINAFMYITASHNPPGYNGLKFGGGNGRVYSQDEMIPLIEKVKMAYLDDDVVQEVVDELSANEVKYTEGDGYIWDNEQLIAQTKARSERYYAKLTTMISTNATGFLKQYAVSRGMKRSLKPQNPVIAVDYNGSSRIRSIDEEYMKKYGIRTVAINTTVGRFAHRIVPEGSSLDQCREIMEKHVEMNIIFGYVPDCDGDRGNIIIYGNSTEKQAQLIDAQTTFALTVLSELAFMQVYFPASMKILCVIANSATSLRVEEMCNICNVPVFYSETGEANVIDCATVKKEEGYIVRIVGEGSNGGNITFPGRIRDPLSTVFSMLKLCFLYKGSKSVYEKALAMIRGGNLGAGNEIHSHRKIAVLAEYLSRYTTTSSFEDEALYKVRTKDQKILKSKYEIIFEREFNEKKAWLKETMDIEAYEFINYEGADERKGKGNRTGTQSGGFKVILYERSGSKKGFLWMRGSKTEPVFRIVADIRGAKETHDELLAWHRGMLKKADIG